MAGCSQPGIHNHRDTCLLDNDPDLRGGFQPTMAADRRAQRHDRGATYVLEPGRQHRIRIDVGQHGPAFFDEDLRRFQRFDRIRKQVVGVRMDLQLDPFGKTGGCRQTGNAHRFSGIHRTGRIR